MDFLPNWNFRGVFSKYHYFVVRISEAAMCGEHYTFLGCRIAQRLQRSSESAAQLRSDRVQCSVTQLNAAYLKGTAYLNRVQCSSLGCSGAQEGAV